LYRVLYATLIDVRENRRVTYLASAIVNSPYFRKLHYGSDGPKRITGEP